MCSRRAAAVQGHAGRALAAAAPLAGDAGLAGWLASPAAWRACSCCCPRLAAHIAPPASAHCPACLRTLPPAPQVEGRYWGFSGCHRYEAHQRLGAEHILCRVRKATPTVLKMHMM